MPAVPRPAARVAALAALVAALGGSLGLTAAGLADTGSSAVLPDLTADLPVRPDAPWDPIDTRDVPGHVLLTFDTVIRNVGAGPLEVDGTRASPTDPMSVVQRLYDALGHVVSTNPIPETMTYVDADGHHHFHLSSTARYTLWTADGTRQVGTDSKIGFCLLDTYRYPDSVGPGRYDTDDQCGHLDPNATSVQMGISPTWGDYYAREIAFQWIDVTGLPPGPYRIRAEVNPDRTIAESDYGNDVAWRDTFVNGLVADDQAVGVTPGAPQTITLGVRPVNGPLTPDAQKVVPRLYQVLSPPAHGTLEDLNAFDPTIVYTPAPGYVGADSFTFRGYDTANGIASLPATVHLAVGTAAPASAAARSTSTTSLPAKPKPNPRGAAVSVRVRWVSRDRLAARIRSGRAGVATLTIRAGGRRVGACVRRVPAGRWVACGIRVGAGAQGAHVVATAVVRAPRSRRLVATGGAAVPAAYRPKPGSN
jgi:hypothetical protein